MTERIDRRNWRLSGTGRVLAVLVLALIALTGVGIPVCVALVCQYHLMKIYLEDAADASNRNFEALDRRVSRIEKGAS